MTGGEGEGRDGGREGCRGYKTVKDTEDSSSDPLHLFYIKKKKRKEKKSHTQKKNIYINCT